MDWKKFIKQSLIFGLLTFFFALTISLVIGEFVVRHLFNQDTYRMARAVGLHFFKEGENIPFTFESNIDSFHHIAYTREFTHSVSTNSQGTRGKEFDKNKAEEVFRILFLGDSMTFGWGVEDDEAYPAVFENLLNQYAEEKQINKKFEVINAGFTDGLTLDSYYVYLKDKGLAFNPDMVVVDLFPYNDVSDLHEMDWQEVDSDGYPQKVISKTQKVKDGYLVSRFKTNWKYEIPVLRNYHLPILIFNAMERGTPQLVERIKNTLGVVEIRPDFTLEERLRCLYSLNKEKCKQVILDNLEKSEFLLAGLNKLSKDNGRQFLVTIMTNADQTVPLSTKEDKDKAYRQVQPQKHFREFLEEKEIDHFDLLPVLSEGNSQQYFFERDGHLTKEGHLVIAEALSEFFIERYLE